VFEAFRESDYRRFWVSQFFSNVGSWMQAVAQGYLVYHLTDSAFLLGFVGFANAVPSFFLMLYGGVLADHFDRRRVVAASQWAQAFSALALAVSIWTGHLAVWQIVAAAVVSGIAISFSAPAWQAMVIDLLDDRSRLANAVAMNSLQFQLSRAIGPLLAGVTLAAFGSFWCFFFNALSFLPLIWVLGRIKPRQQPVEQTSAVWERLRAGFAYVRSDRMILLALAVAAAASAFGFPYLNLMPIVARRLFHAAEARGLGYLMGAVGVGAMLGSLALSVRTPPRRMMLPVIIITLGLFGAALTGVGYLPSRAAVMALLFVCGTSMVICLALCNTSIQQRVPDAMRGRVLSMYTFSFYAFLPFGNLGSGILAEHRGIGLTMLLLGASLLASALVAAFAISRRTRSSTLSAGTEVAVANVDAEWHSREQRG
jgi:MFS family permease